jgi:hypothetical protein
MGHGLTASVDLDFAFLKEFRTQPTETINLSRLRRGLLVLIRWKVSLALPIEDGVLRLSKCFSE